jgi:TRAP-type C4-dicarboxylate transport system substrate-binding protein
MALGGEAMGQRITATTAAIGGLLAATGLAAPAAAETWDMPMAYAASNFHSETGAAFARCVTEGTDGAIEVVTHPSGSLFGGADIKRAVQTGQVPIGERLLSAHQNEDPLFGIDSIPFLATSFAEAERLWDLAEGPMRDLLEAQNLHLLYSVPWPPQGLYFKKPVDELADMEGVKFRSYNAATARLAELAGMTPVQIEAAEISQAFATGVASSMISSGATGYDRKVWASLTHFYEVNAWLPRNYVFANLDAWNDLAESERAVFEGCADLAAYAGYWRAVQYTDFTTNQLAANGMTVAEPSGQLEEQLKEIGRTMTEEWLAEAGDAARRVIADYREATGG